MAEYLFQNFFLILFFVLFTALFGHFVLSGMKLKTNLSLSLPIGFVLIFFTTVLSYKLNILDQKLVMLLVLCGLLLFALIRQRRQLAQLLFSSREYLLQSLMLASVVFILYIPILTKSFDLVPAFSSFDTSSGDMYFYINMSEHLKNVGWHGLTNQRFFFTPFDNGRESLSGLDLDHAGIGFVTLSAFASLLGMKTFEIGFSCLLVLWAILICAALDLSYRITENWRFSILLGFVCFASQAYLTLIGWWAVNQIVFSIFLLLFLQVSLINIDGNQSAKVKFWKWSASSLLVTLSVETYPAVAGYSIVPLYLCFLAFIIVRELRGGTKEFGALTASFAPFAFLALGTAGYLPKILFVQISHSLSMGYNGPGLFDLLGIPLRFASKISNYLSPLSQIDSPLLIAFFFLASLTLFTIRKQLEVRFLVFYLLIAGGLVLAAYASIDPFSYQSHKILLLWGPIALLLVISLWGYCSKNFLRFFSKPFAFVGISMLVLTNIFFSGAYIGSLKVDSTSRQLHSISNEAMEVNKVIIERGITHVLLDMSDGKSWVPLDRTTSGALVSYPGPMVYSSAQLAGYPYYSGWVVQSTDVARNFLKEAGGFLPINDFYSLSHVCRLVCTETGSQVSAWISGLPILPSEEAKFSDTSLLNGAGPKNISLYVEGPEGSKLRVKILFFSALQHRVCSSKAGNSDFKDIYIEIGRPGYSRVPLSLPTDCFEDVKLIRILSAE